MLRFARELNALLVLLVVLLSVLTMLTGCGPAVRDKKVYRAEIDFMEAAASEQVERGIALIDSVCKCEEIADTKGFVTTECHELAETILVVKYRTRYHTEFMRYLGGISNRRPPEDPPEVPETSTLCPDIPIDVPMRAPDELEGDAGTD